MGIYTLSANVAKYRYITDKARRSTKKAKNAKKVHKKY